MNSELNYSDFFRIEQNDNTSRYRFASKVTGAVGNLKLLKEQALSDGIEHAKLLCFLFDKKVSGEE